MIENVIEVAPDEPVEKVLGALKKKKSQIAVVLSEEGDLIGYLTMAVLLKNLLPVSLSMQVPGQNQDIVLGAAPGIAKRLRKVKPLPVSDIMERSFHALAPSTPVWEGVQMLVEHGAPVFVLEEGSERYVGVMTEASALEELERIQKDQTAA
jgi:CBS-domain-containing membrane protein